MGNLEERQDEHQGGVNNNSTGGEGRQETNPSPSMGRHEIHSQSYTGGILCLTCSCSFTRILSVLDLQGSRSKAKPTAGNPSHLTWVRPTLEGSVLLQCPPSTPREIITDKPKPNLNGAGTTDPHPQVSEPLLSVIYLPSNQNTWS